MANELGCFGSVVIRVLKHPLCATCDARARCADAARGNIADLREEIGVGALEALASLSPSTTRAKVRRAEEPRVARPEGLSAKGRSLVEALAARGIDGETLRAIIQLPQEQRHRRVAAIRPDYLRLVVEVLARRGAVDKTELREGYERAFNWTRGTAASHVAIAANALAHLRVVEDRGSVLERSAA